jgi:hypothetical protein
MRTFRDAFARAAASPTPDVPDLGGILAALDVPGPVWSTADDARAAHVAWFLDRTAVLTGDPVAFDLAQVWAARCGHALPPAPRTDSFVARAHRALATCTPRGQRVAHDLGDELGPGDWPAEPVDVCDGPWAGVLLHLESARPALAVAPGAARSI